MTEKSGLLNAKNLQSFPALNGPHPKWREQKFQSQQGELDLWATSSGNLPTPHFWSKRRAALSNGPIKKSHSICWRLAPGLSADQICADGRGVFV